MQLLWCRTSTATCRPYSIDFGLNDCFETVVESARAGVRKPDPAIFGLALKALQLPPEACAVVGDSYKNDIAPSRALGINTIWLKGRGWEPDNDNRPAGSIISDLTELYTLYHKHKKEKREYNRLHSLHVIEEGFEPSTHSLEGCCSIQLSYPTRPPIPNMVFGKSVAKVNDYIVKHQICIRFFKPDFYGVFEHFGWKPHFPR